MRLRCHLAAARGDRTIAELARISEIPRPYLSQIEAGRMVPTNAELERIVAAYGVELDDVFDWWPPQFVAVETDPKEET